MRAGGMDAWTHCNRIVGQKYISLGVIVSGFSSEDLQRTENREFKGGHFSQIVHCVMVKP